MEYRDGSNGGNGNNGGGYGYRNYDNRDGRGTNLQYHAEGSMHGSGNSMRIRVYHMFNNAAKGFDGYMKLAKKAPEELQDDFLKLAEGELKECEDNLEIYQELVSMEGTSSRASGGMAEMMNKEIDKMEKKFENFEQDNYY